jgi:signal peptidase I
LGVAFAATIMLKQTYWAPYVLMSWFVVLNVVWLYAVIDSWWVARRTNPAYQLKDYNRWYVYLILVTLWLPTTFNYAMLIRVGLYEAFYIPTNSMRPTIPSGTRVLADKLVYRTEPVRRGDVIVFVNPNDRRQRWIKRVVALSGETVEIKGGRLYVNGDALPLVLAEDAEPAPDPECSMFWEENGQSEYQIIAPADETEADSDFAETLVPPGHCFVLGDDRVKSRDSRHVGPIPLIDVIGRADLIYFPKFRRLHE